MIGFWKKQDPESMPVHKNAEALAFDGTKKYGDDVTIERLLINICTVQDLSPVEAVKLFPAIARRQWLKRFLAHTELFKMTLHVPGDIAELGVYRGQGLMTWANLLECYCIGSRTKIVYGFENWEGFTEVTDKDAGPIKYMSRHTGAFKPEPKAKVLLKELMHIFDLDRFIPWKNRIDLIDGDIEQTVPKFITDNPGVRFSLVHFDCDIYKPTITALKAIWPRVVKGGIVIFDEYAIHDWPGETAAFDEFFAQIPVKPQCFDWTNSPACYVVKE